MEMSHDLANPWRAHRHHLVGLAFRMLGDIGAAEDVVQEAFTRLARAQDVDDDRAWLTTVTGRLCLDQLRSARMRRETPADPADLTDRISLTQPPAADPADRITLDQEVQVAMFVVLQRLSPAERVAFILHDVFSLPFDSQHLERLHQDADPVRVESAEALRKSRPDAGGDRGIGARALLGELHARSPGVLGVDAAVDEPGLGEFGQRAAHHRRIEAEIPHQISGSVDAELNAAQDEKVGEVEIRGGRHMRPRVGQHGLAEPEQRVEESQLGRRGIARFRRARCVRHRLVNRLTHARSITCCNY